MNFNRKPRTTFGKISVNYDQARPGYDKKIIAAIIKLSHLKKDATILDIGCGTGQMSIPLAKRGYTVLGLDISKNMIRIARQKMLDNKNLLFKHGSFETFQGKAKSVDLIICAQAWHWVAPVKRYEKVSRLLKDNGTLALVWSYHRKEKSSFLGAVGKILDKYGKLTKKTILMRDYAQNGVFKELKGNQLFSHVTKHIYQINLKFERDRYHDFVLTFSWIQQLSKIKRDALSKDLKNLLQKQKKYVVIPQTIVLIMANKRGGKF